MPFCCCSTLLRRLEHFFLLINVSLNVLWHTRTLRALTYKRYLLDLLPTSLSSSSRPFVFYRALRRKSWQICLHFHIVKATRFVTNTERKERQYLMAEVPPCAYTRYLRLCVRCCLSFSFARLFSTLVLIQRNPFVARRAQHCLILISSLIKKQKKTFNIRTQH